jgi:hypothetical protein
LKNNWLQFLRLQSTFFFRSFKHNGVIYYRVTRSSTAVRQSLHTTKRDLELIRNILILFITSMLAGILSLVSIIVFSKTKSGSKAFYLFGAMGVSIAATIEKICLLFLNKEIRKETTKLLNRLHLIHISNHNDVHPSSVSNATNIKIVELNISKSGNKLEDKRRTNNEQNLVGHTLPVID